MAQQLTQLRTPGDGADRPHELPRIHKYVYVARSRRAGGLSLGIDLTPQGHCSFSCVYCQASHPLVKNPELLIDVRQLEDELRDKLQSHESSDPLRDLVLAGSGEPTSVRNLDEVLSGIRRVCSEAGFHQPLRIFTNARHFGQASVNQTLGSWIEQGGEVWVKLDGASAASVEAINGRRFDVPRHLEGIWNFARSYAVGIQTLVCEGPELPSVEGVIDEVTEALAKGLSQGAKLTELHLLTLSRMPSDPEQAGQLTPVDAPRLEQFAAKLRAQTGLTVKVYPA